MLNATYVFFTLLVGVEHLYFLVLEMFFWTTPKVMKIFGVKSEEIARDSRSLAANLGLYNGFLGAGVLWSFITQNYAATTFFLICVIIAGIYGAYSAKKCKIFFVQTLPAVFALVAMCLR